MYIAPLPNVGGFLVEGALVWAATALTKATLSATTTETESPLFLTSGLQLDHAFRRRLRCETTGRHRATTACSDCA
jgi:hypothetical protein